MITGRLIKNSIKIARTFYLTTLRSKYTYDFFEAYIALLSMMNVYRAYTCIQNAIDQTAMQVSEYAYIAKKLGVHSTK